MEVATLVLHLYLIFWGDPLELDIYLLWLASSSSLLHQPQSNEISVFTLGKNEILLEILGLDYDFMLKLLQSQMTKRLTGFTFV